MKLPTTLRGRQLRVLTAYKSIALDPNLQKDAVHWKKLAAYLTERTKNLQKMEDRIAELIIKCRNDDDEIN